MFFRDVKIFCFLTALLTLKHFYSIKLLTDIWTFSVPFPLLFYIVTVSQDLLFALAARVEKASASDGFREKHYVYLSPLGGGVELVLGFHSRRQIFLQNGKQFGNKIIVCVQNKTLILPIQDAVVVFINYCSVAK